MNVARGRVQRLLEQEARELEHDWVSARGDAPPPRINDRIGIAMYRGTVGSFACG